MSAYKASLTRNTLETNITMSVDFSQTEGFGLRGTSGVGFFDHMLNSLAVHSRSVIELSMSGDLNVDCHHTIEDVGIVLGKILAEIISERGAIMRYGTAFIPMDEALASAVIDVSGRPFIVCGYTPNAPMIGDYDTQMTAEFFRAVAFNMGATLHISVLYGENDHHCVEAMFKAFAHALADAMVIRGGEVLSAKGSL